MRWTHVLDEYFRHRAAQDLFSGAVLITQGATRLHARVYGYASRGLIPPQPPPYESQSTKQPQLLFRALLSEGGAERFELTKA